MNWEALGTIAEILGAGGVIASLLYLSQQIRQNTKATRLAMSHSLATAIRDFNSPMLADPVMAQTLRVGAEDPTRLTTAERDRFMQLCWRLFSTFEDAHYQYRNGALEEEVWASFAGIFMLYAKSPGMQLYWSKRRELYQPVFQDLIDSGVAPDLQRVDSVLAELSQVGSDEVAGQAGRTGARTADA